MYIYIYTYYVYITTTFTHFHGENASSHLLGFAPAVPPDEVAKGKGRDHGWSNDGDLGFWQVLDLGKP